MSAVVCLCLATWGEGTLVPVLSPRLSLGPVSSPLGSGAHPYVAEPGQEPGSPSPTVGPCGDPGALRCFSDHTPW